MIKLNCKSCGGEYFDVCDDGLRYFHVCPQIKFSEDVYIDRPDMRNENVGKEKQGKGVDIVAIIEEI